MKEKIIRGLVSSIIVILLICLEWKLSFNVINDFETVECTYVVEDFYQINNCDIDGNRLIPTNTDPQIVLKFDGNVVDSVTLFLAEANDLGINGQLYFFDRNGFSSKNFMQVNLDEGCTEQTWSVNRRNTSFLRIDLDGEVSIDHIEIIAQIAHINYVKLIAWLAFCVIFDLLIGYFIYKRLIWIWKNVNKRINNLDSFIIQIGRKIKINIEIFFVFFVLVMGVVYSFIIPIGLVPDESVHVAFMCDAIGANGVSDQYYNILLEGHILDEVRDEKVDVDRALYKDISTIKFDKKNITFTFGIKKEIVRYIPCGIGFWLGYLFDLPIVWCAQFGEISALLFFAVIGYLVLKIMPVYKEVLCAIMLLPMNLQQCSSFNYDSVLLPLCYLFFAYIMYLKYRKEQINLKSYAVMIVLLALIALIKIPYILLGGLYFIIPEEKKRYKIDRRAKVAIICVVIVAGGIGVYLMRNSFMVYSVLGSVFEIRETLRIFSMTLRQFSVFYLQGMVGIFGWLDCYLPNWMVLFSLVSILVFAQIPQQEQTGEKVWNRVLLVIISLAISVLIMIGLLQWFMIYLGIDISTMTLFRQGLSQVSAIYGVQGRYWLPILPCSVFALASIIPNKENKMVIWQCCYYVIIAVVPIYELAYRYWI